jgi:hypothetical protein
VPGVSSSNRILDDDEYATSLTSASLLGEKEEGEYLRALVLLDAHLDQYWRFFFTASFAVRNRRTNQRELKSLISTEASAESSKRANPGSQSCPNAPNDARMVLLLWTCTILVGLYNDDKQ